MNSILSTAPSMVLYIVVINATCIPRKLWKTLPVVHMSSTLGVLSIIARAHVIVRLSALFAFSSFMYSGWVFVNRVVVSMTLTLRVSYSLLTLVRSFLWWWFVLSRRVIRVAAEQVRKTYSFIVARTTADLTDSLVRVEMLTRLMTVALTSMKAGLVTSRLNAGRVSVSTWLHVVWPLAWVALVAVGLDDRGLGARIRISQSTRVGVHVVLKSRKCGGELNGVLSTLYDDAPGKLSGGAHGSTFTPRIEPLFRRGQSYTPLLEPLFKRGQSNPPAYTMLFACAV